MRIHVTCFLALFTMLSTTGAALPTERPNIVLIIADDMNWNDCGAYGHDKIRTPNIDQLARDGLIFQHAYLTTNSCSPSRSSIITSKYPHNTGAEQLHWPLPEGSTTFVELLKKSGYYTAAVGKWHLGDAAKKQFHVVREASTAGFQLPSGPNQSAPRMVAAEPSGCEQWVAALKARPKGRPFFFWLAALDPHREYVDGALQPPHQVNDVTVPPYLPDVPEVREDMRQYYDEIGRLDLYVGKVVKELQTQGVQDNTLVVFISDNGRPFPRDKTTLYDGGIRTPLIVRWPGMVKQGTVSTSLASSIDLGPTFLDVAGLKPGDSFEGRSLLPIFRNPQATVRKFVFAEDHWHDFEDHARCIANQRFKLIRNDYPDLPATPSADAPRSPTWQVMLKLNQRDSLTDAQLNCCRQPRPSFELYDLQTDPHELQNVIADKRYQTEREALMAELKRWSVRTKDFLPTKRTPDEFDRVTGEPDHSVRVRPRRSKMEMFGTNGAY